MQTATNEITCPNCLGGLLTLNPLKKIIDSYCPRLECELSSNYTDTFYIAYLHYKNTGLNLSPFRFGGGTPSTNQQSKHL